MALIGFFLMTIGIAAIVVPLNDMGITNLNAQFLGLSVSICGAVIMTGGILQDTMTNLFKANSGSTGTQAILEKKPSSNASDNYILASDYATSIGKTTDHVIEGIKDGSIRGTTIEGFWFVDKKAAEGE